MQIKILKGADEIGGSCVKISTANTTILIDYGTPLSDNSIAPTINDEKIDAILISHPHQDHYGQIVNIDKRIPVYCGELSLNLMNATRIFTGHDLMKNNFHHFNSWKQFTIGDFTITPYLVDHSATDAYAFLIEAKGKRVLYSGDFRANGRKSKLFDRMLEEKVLKDLDVLLMEGTMIQRDNGEFKTESDVEDKIHETIKESNLISFMIGSSQNIDSLVSAFRACVKTNKTFVVDIYTAWILENIKKVSSGTMNLDFKNVRVYKPTYKTGGSQYGKVQDNEEYFKSFKFEIFHEDNIITFDKIKQNPSRYFIKCSPWYIENMLEAVEKEKANIIYSQWLGYLKEEYSDERTARLFANLQRSHNWVYAHTSGHADLDTLKIFANALRPKKLVPIHTEYKEDFEKHFENVAILEDKDLLDLEHNTITKYIEFEHVYEDRYSDLKVVDLVDFKADIVEPYLDDLNCVEHFTLKDDTLTLKYNDYEDSINSKNLVGFKIDSVEVKLSEDVGYGAFKETDVTADLIGENEFNGFNMDEANRLHECIESQHDCNYVDSYSFIINLEIKMIKELI